MKTVPFAAALAYCLATTAVLCQSKALKRAEHEAGMKSRIARPERVADAIELVDSPNAPEYGRPGATYVALHFKNVHLGAHDSLTLHTPDEYTRSVTYRQVHHPFWAISIPGSRAMISLQNNSGTASYIVDRYRLGLANNSVIAVNQPSFAPQEVCGDDDTKEAACYAQDTKHEKAKAVARLLINGEDACTGWLVGPEGYLLTNEHCVHDETDSVQVEFMAEGASCDVDCNRPFACPGDVVAAPELNPAQFIVSSRKNDFALLKLDSSVVQKYGYLQMRKGGPKKDEAIYIPQHPRAVGKRLLVNSSDPADRPSGIAHVNTLDAPACEGGPAEMGYQADTDPGASGSPIIGAIDNLVIGLHHCGGCPNHAIPITRVISGLGKKLPKGTVK
jgi:lysyl endopeptidase